MRSLKIAAAVLVSLIIVSGLGLLVAVRQLEPRLHGVVTASLSQSLQSEISLGPIHLTWIPFRLTARDLTIRHRGRPDIPPLIAVSSFTVDLHPMDLWNATVEHVRVDGMEINIPPRDTDTGKRPLPHPQGGGGGTGRTLTVRHLTATNTRLAVIPREAGKDPKLWDISKLEMAGLGAEAQASFRASLSNPLPYGTIETTGHFGPWNAGEPGLSGVEGEYTFAADLGTIKGLQGGLNAIGTMSGVLERIATRGDTRTPDFALTTLDGGSLPLTTRYDAIVDGTKGDVELTRVDIMLGESALQARGTVEGTRGLKGKRVMLNITSSTVNLAELLHLVSKAEPPMARGTVTIDAAFDLPQGPEDVLDQLALEGSFRADRLRFADAGVQGQVDTLSRRAQGRPDDESIDNVASNVTSRFVLKKGVMTYRDLTFKVRGAVITLNGTHRLDTKTLSLAGAVRLDASASNTMTGFKRWMVKPFDALLRQKGAGTRLVIRVSGTQDQPAIALELGKTLRGQ